MADDNKRNSSKEETTVLDITRENLKEFVDRWQPRQLPLAITSSAESRGIELGRVEPVTPLSPSAMLQWMSKADKWLKFCHQDSADSSSTPARKKKAHRDEIEVMINFSESAKRRNSLGLGSKEANTLASIAATKAASVDVGRNHSFCDKKTTLLANRIRQKHADMRKQLDECTFRFAVEALECGARSRGSSSSNLLSVTPVSGLPTSLSASNLPGPGSIPVAGRDEVSETRFAIEALDGGVRSSKRGSSSSNLLSVNPSPGLPTSQSTSKIPSPGLIPAADSDEISEKVFGESLKNSSLSICSSGLGSDRSVSPRHTGCVEMVVKENVNAPVGNPGTEIKSELSSISKLVPSPVEPLKTALKGDQQVIMRPKPTETTVGNPSEMTLRRQSSYDMLRKLDETCTSKILSSVKGCQQPPVSTGFSEGGEASAQKQEDTRRVARAYQSTFSSDSGIADLDDCSASKNEISGKVEVNRKSQRERKANANQTQTDHQRGSEKSSNKSLAQNVEHSRAEKKTKSVEEAVGSLLKGSDVNTKAATRGDLDTDERPTSVLNTTGTDGGLQTVGLSRNKPTRSSAILARPSALLAHIPEPPCSTSVPMSPPRRKRHSIVIPEVHVDEHQAAANVSGSPSSTHATHHHKSPLASIGKFFHHHSSSSKATPLVTSNPSTSIACPVTSSSVPAFTPGHTRLATLDEYAQTSQRQASSVHNNSFTAPSLSAIERRSSVKSALVGYAGLKPTPSSSISSSTTAGDKVGTTGSAASLLRRPFWQKKK